MTMPSLHHYEQLADLFEYPDEAYPNRVLAASACLAGRYADAAAALQEFAGALPWTGDMSAVEAMYEVQEIFTRSFDVQAVTTLSVGYVVFGDDYKRGELLVNLNRECREAGVDCGSELSDHLPNVLRLIARWQDRELVAELVEEIVRPALQRMIAEFGDARMGQRNRVYRKHFRTLIDSSGTRATIFREPLAALLMVLNVDFIPVEQPHSPVGSDFLRSITRELEIEAEERGPTPSRSLR